MAFTQDTFAPSGHVSGKSPTLYTYVSTDNLSDLLAPSYFTNKRFQLDENDVVFANLSGGNYVLQVSADTSTVKLYPVGLSLFVNKIIGVGDTAHTVMGPEVIECFNTDALEITLNTSAANMEQLHVIKFDGPVRLIGPINGQSFIDILDVFDAPNLIFRANSNEWSFI